MNDLVVDNTVLSNFGRVRQTDLVTRSWSGVVYTIAPAMAEYRTGVTLRSLPVDAWSSLRVVMPTPGETAFAATLPKPLSLTDRGCIAVALNRGDTLATDDRDARIVAHRHGVAVIGTLGILVVAVDQGIVGRSEANRLLGAMIAAGFHSPYASLDPLLDEEGRT